MTFSADPAGVRHLGLPLSRDEGTGQYTGIVQQLGLRISRWAGHCLSFLGRAYKAKQMLVSALTYQAAFIPIPPHLQRQTCSASYTFVAASRQLAGQPLWALHA